VGFRGWLGVPGPGDCVPSRYWLVLNLIIILRWQGWMLTWIRFDDVWVCLLSSFFSMLAILVALCWQYLWMTFPPEPCWLLAV
jgi:hypothetical protein